jgi:hypothetical protein
MTSVEWWLWIMTFFIFINIDFYHQHQTWNQEVQLTGLARSIDGSPFDFS